MPRPVSIRQSLLLNLVLVILVLGGGILATTVFGARSAVRALSSTITTRTLDEIEARLHGFFDPVTAELRVARSWVEAGLLDLDDPTSINRLFEAVLREHPQISSVIVADRRGHECMLMHFGGAWRGRRVRPDEWGSRAEWLDWSDERPEPVGTTETLDYDPRHRPWFTGAMTESEHATASGREPDVHWTRPYTFFTSRDPGITAAVTAVDPRGVVHVIAYDVLLNDVARFTAGLSASPNGLVFVLSTDGQLIGLRADRFWPGEAERRAALLRTPRELGVDVVTVASTALRDSDRTTDPVRFESEDQAWWGDALEFSVSARRRLWIAVLVPERDLLGGLVATRLWIIGITLVVLATTIARAVFLARLYSRPIEALVAQSDRISRGDLEPGPRIPSKIREVGRLAEAQDRMRVGLRSLLKLERDLQLARQVQQSTFPTALPALRGYELVAWSEPAEETGGDTYDVIGYASRSASGETPTRHLTIDRADGALLMLADATGHGIGPALSAAEVRAMLRMAVRLDEDLPVIARHVNEQLVADLPPGRFVTVWFGEVAAGEDTLMSFSAGQAPLLHYDASRGDIDVRDADTVPLGVVPELPTTAAVPIRLAEGDVFAVLSDGLYEAMNPDDELLGLERVKSVILANHHHPPDRILEALREAVRLFVRGRAPTDDCTAIILKRRDAARAAPPLARGKERTPGRIKDPPPTG